MDRRSRILTSQPPSTAPALFFALCECDRQLCNVARSPSSICECPHSHENHATLSANPARGSTPSNFIFLPQIEQYTGTVVIVSPALQRPIACPAARCFSLDQRGPRRRQERLQGAPCKILACRRSGFCAFWHTMRATPARDCAATFSRYDLLPRCTCDNGRIVRTRKHEASNSHYWDPARPAWRPSRLSTRRKGMPP